MDAVTSKGEAKAGVEGHSHVVRPAEMEWQKTSFPGCEAKPLYFDPKTGIATLLMKGVLVTVNQSLDSELVKDVARQFGADATVISVEEQLENEAIEGFLEEMGHSGRHILRTTRNNPARVVHRFWARKSGGAVVRLSDVFNIGRYCRGAFAKSRRGALPVDPAIFSCARPHRANEGKPPGVQGR